MSPISEDRDGTILNPRKFESVTITLYTYRQLCLSCCARIASEATSTSLGEMASTLQINRLHPTFGAEVEGVDFSKPISDEQLAEIKDIVAQVSRLTQAANAMVIGETPN